MQEFYWSYMAHAAYATIVTCKSCALITRATNKIFITRIFAIKYVGHCCKRHLRYNFTYSNWKSTRHCNYEQSLHTITRDTESTFDGLTRRKGFYGRTVIPFDILTYLLTKNDPRFARKDSSTICTRFGVKRLTTRLTTGKKWPSHLLQQNDWDTSKPLHSGDPETLRNLHRITHVWVQLAGLLTSEQHTVQSCLKRAPANTNRFFY